MLKLFTELAKGSMFHFYDRPDRILIKEDKAHYISPEGRRRIDPYVAVVERKPVKDQSTYLNKKEG